ncbi:hypothetical protein [Blautia sp. An81]|uniref:hypothetical protein n=1 Tax=Blautia sp. An81 TaxID=1965659 RepID=UPI000B3A6D50|nr:hypothetical protein [Blautia sp. An81]OUN25845.1 hypothetical protein B5G33_17460 [Blautia sp. An81]
MSKRISANGKKVLGYIVKLRGFCLILCVCPILAGCNKNSVDVKEKAEEEIVSMEEAEYSFPEKYEKSSDSGKVKFNCKLEVPENIKGQAISTAAVKGLYSCDREKAWSIFGEGKEVIEKPETPVAEGRAPEDYYLFADDEILDINEGITYGSSNSKYYLNIGVSNPDNEAVFEETGVSFKNGEECITELKEIIDELGYHPEDFIFACYPLNFQVMKNLEEQYLQEDYLTEEKRKESWSQEDDAYFIYAYQKYEGIPIFHELMSIARIMAYDTPDNAPIQAIYSTRGIEQLSINSVYAFENGEMQVSLKPFEDIAAVVEEKFENILNDADYEVTRAKFYERVYLNEEQKYEADPIWYFEVVENNTSKSVTLINAETGKEIFLQ